MEKPVRSPRSPILGYNHNIQFHGQVFHVQTEDSGAQHARLFTHLFVGGTILASKKHEYDPNAPKVVVVKPPELKRPPVSVSSSAEGVVVKRNVIINVGGGSAPVLMMTLRL